jgi:hypothetical protein
MGLLIVAALSLAPTSESSATAVGAGLLLVGNGTAGFAGDGGPATAAELNGPTELAYDGAGDLLIADTGNNRIRLVAAAACSSDCPLGLAAMTAGSIYTVAGGGAGGDGAAATSAALSGPAGLALDANGDLLLSDTFDHRVRLVANMTCASSCPYGLPSTVRGDIYTVAGNGTAGGTGDGGPATEAELAYPSGLTIDTSGDVLIAVWDGVRMIANNACSSHCPFGLSSAAVRDIYTIAGGGSYGLGGPATSASLNPAGAIATDPAGDLVLASGTVDLIAARSCVIDCPYGLPSMAPGYAYKVAGGGSGADGGEAGSAALRFATGVAVDLGGNLITGDGGNSDVRLVVSNDCPASCSYGLPEMTSDHIYTIAADTGRPGGVAVDPSGDLARADTSANTVFSVSGGPSGPAEPVSVTATGAGAGIVTGGGMDCPSLCSKSFAAGSQVTLHAWAAPGSQFTGWSGGGCAASPDCVVSSVAAATVAATFGLSAAPAVTQSTFIYTGTEQVYFVPPRVTEIHAVVVGAAGGSTYEYSNEHYVDAGGFGARISLDIPVSPGEPLFLDVGGNGKSNSQVPTFNGGGPGGQFAASGGGASEIRTYPGDFDVEPLTNPTVVVAGGGGGGGAHYGEAAGGNAGQSGNGLTGGGAGTASAGGVGGTDGSGLAQCNGTAGTTGSGGTGALGGGGGGGGHFGGGGGGAATQVQPDGSTACVMPQDSGGGGGGSSAVVPWARNVSIGTDATGVPEVVITAPVPSVQSVPAVVGSPVVGQVLTSTAVAWSGGPTRFGYQWLRCGSTGLGCTPISGADVASYTLQAADLGARVVVQETATNDYGQSDPAVSAATGVIGEPPVAVQMPTVAGTALVGRTLTEGHGTWTDSPTGYSYVWDRCDPAGGACTAIMGAAGQSYTLGSADAGATVRVQETASNAFGIGGSAVSAPTGVVSVPVPPVASINGSHAATVGETSTYAATVIDDEGAPTSYRWTVGQRLLGTKSTLSYTFTTAGRRTLTLTVKDSAGHTLTATLPITAAEHAVQSPVEFRYGRQATGLAFVYLVAHEVPVESTVTVSCNGPGCRHANARMAVGTPSCRGHCSHGAKGRPAAIDVDITRLVSNTPLRPGARVTLTISKTYWIPKVVLFSVTPNRIVSRVKTR